MTCDEINSAIAALNAANTVLDAQILVDNAALTTAMAGYAAATADYGNAVNALNADVNQKGTNNGMIAEYQSMLAMQGC
jgi:hypothetical protein